jgi:hypothetical protein
MNPRYIAGIDYITVVNTNKGKLLQNAFNVLKAVTISPLFK